MSLPATRSIWRYLRASRLNLLLVLVPVAFLARLLGGGDVLVFGVAALALVPLAGLIGETTDELSKYTGPGVGGLLNATFGNATELILVLLGLRAGLVEVVKASLTGSILGNLLLVLGLAMLAGGWGRSRQTFSRTATGVSVAMLFLAAASLLMPAVFALTLYGQLAAETPLLFEISLLVSGVLLLLYLASLVFSLNTHRDLLATPEHEAGDPPSLSRGAALALLLVATLATTATAETLVGSVEAATRALGLTEFFVGIVVIAVVGNAAEHFAAVLLARRNRMNLAVSIAIGSGTQVALLVAPLAVIASGLLGHPMPLLFNAFEIAAIGIAVFAVHLVTADGESNWFEGAMLIAVYAMLAILFAFVPE